MSKPTPPTAAATDAGAQRSTRPTTARGLFFALLYFSEGAPIGYIWWAMPTRLRAAGMPVEDVAALVSLLALPWAFKFLWAPAIDRFRGPRWGYRAWITVAQILMGLTLLPLALLNLTDIIAIAAGLLIAHAVCAATQDVAIDALAVSTIPHAQRARLTAWMQTGYLLARATFGGLALAAESWIGAHNVVLILLGCIWFTLAVVWFYPLPRATDLRSLRSKSVPKSPDASPTPESGVDGDPPEEEPTPPRTFLQTLLAAFERRTTWIGIAIALIAGAGFEAIGGLVGPFLLDRGSTAERNGWFFAIPVVACMIVGSILGGLLADRLGHRRLVATSVAAIAAWIGLVGIADHFGLAGIPLMALIAPIYIGVGLLVASSYALFMDLSDPAVGATQFSTFMGATNLCEVWAVAAAGAIAGQAGYATAFSTTALISLLALLLLPYINAHRPRHSS